MSVTNWTMINNNFASNEKTHISVSFVIGFLSLLVPLMMGNIRYDR